MQSQITSYLTVQIKFIHLQYLHSHSSTLRSSPPPHLIPLLPLHPVRRLHFRLLLPDIVPVGAQDRAAALAERFVHSSLGLVAAVRVDLLKHFVERRLSLSFVIPQLLLQVHSHSVPVFTAAIGHGNCFRSCSSSSPSLRDSQRHDSLSLESLPPHSFLLPQLDLYLGGHDPVEGLVRHNGVSKVKL